MLVANGCGRFVVVGGEGSGNGFTATANGFRPQLGYHSTLVRDPEDSSKFDFFTKARVRYHFERELAVPGEVYTLRFIEEPNGNRLTLDYLAGDANPRTLDSVTDSSGRALLFEYRKIFHADRIVRVTGRNSINDGTLLGLQIVYDYDDVGNLVTATRTSPDPGAGLGDERVERYTYSSSRLEDRHNLLTYTDPNGNTTTYAYYDAADSIAGVETFGLGAENFAGKKHEIVRAIQEPEGVTTRFGYDFLTKTRTVTDPRSEDPQDPAPPPPTRYVLNDYGATVRIEAPLGKTTVMQWCTDAPHPACPDPEGRPGRDALMISMTDAEGRTHQYEYADGRGNLTKETIRFSASKAPVTTADGVTPVAEVTTVTAYDPTFSRAVSKTDAESRTTVFLVDADYPGRPTFCPDGSPGRSTGNLLGIRDAAGNVTCYAYAANGDLTHVTDPRNFVTALTTYDPYGNAEQIVDPVGNVTTKSFDERSREVEMRDTFRHHTRFAYDGLDRPIREERLDDLGYGGAPQIVERRHRAGGELVRETDGLGQVTTYTYDGMNRLRRRRDEGVRQSDGTVAALETTLAYDRSGNQTGVTDPRGVTRTHAYDALGRRVETRVAGPFGASQVESSSTYDLAGNRVTETDLHGHRTTLVYDGLYRVVATELPFTHAFIELPAAGAARIRTAYDRVGNKVLETDANGHPMTFAYDAISRMIRKTDANGNIVAYTYDAAGNLTSESNLTTGLVNEFLEFDGRNRVTRKRQTVRLGAVGSATAVYATTIE
jgi:YD repeat-containing protein